MYQKMLEEKRALQLPIHPSCVPSILSVSRAGSSAMASGGGQWDSLINQSSGNAALNQTGTHMMIGSLMKQSTFKGVPWVSNNEEGNS